MTTLEGKVAFITGAARGQGRSHALRLAQEGVKVIASDLCDDIDSIPYPLATKEDLSETVRMVEGAGGQIIARTADVRSTTELRAVLDEGLAEFGRLDIVIANAGIAGF